MTECLIYGTTETTRIGTNFRYVRVDVALNMNRRVALVMRSMSDSAQKTPTKRVEQAYGNSEVEYVDKAMDGNEGTKTFFVHEPVDDPPDEETENLPETDEIETRNEEARTDGKSMEGTAMKILYCIRSPCGPWQRRKGRRNCTS